jgi:hypothetical protein
MLVNISPTVASGHETYCSLKFASQVNQVQLGTAKKNITITTRSISAAPTATPAPVPALPHAAPTSAPATGPPHNNPHHPSPPPARARQPLTHQSSFLTSSSSASPAIITTLVPSQASHSGNGTRSQLAIAPAARVAPHGPASCPAEVSQSQLKQAPVSLQSMRAKRPGAAPLNPPGAAAVAAGPSFGATAQGSAMVTQASKRVKAAKSGTWR